MKDELPKPNKVIELTDENIAAATGLSIEKVREERQRRAGSVKAAMTPLPGPVADAFALVPSEKVGPHEVRPFYDLDFELLQAMDHPLHRALFAGEGERGVPTRGPAAWQLCFLMTSMLDEAEAAVTDKTIEAKAKAKFGKSSMAGLLAVMEAVYKQLDRYWAPMLRYEQDTEDGSKKNVSLAPVPAKTASAG